MPGVRLQYSGRSGAVRVVSSRGTRGCTGYIVDGVAVGRGMSGDDQGLPQAHEIIGVEVFQPTESIAGRPPSNCLTVLIWTKAMLGG
jgi:hypothetical protein